MVDSHAEHRVTHMCHLQVRTVMECGCSVDVMRVVAGASGDAHIAQVEFRVLGHCPIIE